MSIKTRAFMAATIAFAMYGGNNGFFSPLGDKYSGVGMGTVSYDNFDHKPQNLPGMPKSKKMLKARAMSKIQKKSRKINRGK